MAYDPYNPRTGPSIEQLSAAAFGAQPQQPPVVQQPMMQQPMAQPQQGGGMADFLKMFLGPYLQQQAQAQNAQIQFANDAKFGRAQQGLYGNGQASPFDTGFFKTAAQRQQGERDAFNGLSYSAGDRTLPTAQAMAAFAPFPVQQQQPNLAQYLAPSINPLDPRMEANSMGTAFFLPGGPKPRVM